MSQHSRLVSKMFIEEKCISECDSHLFGSDLKPSCRLVCEYLDILVYKVRRGIPITWNEKNELSTRVNNFTQGVRTQNTVSRNGLNVNHAQELLFSIGTDVYRHLRDPDQHRPLRGELVEMFTGLNKDILKRIDDTHALLHPEVDFKLMNDESKEFIDGKILTVHGPKSGGSFPGAIYRDNRGILYLAKVGSPNSMYDNGSMDSKFLHEQAAWLEKIGGDIYYLMMDQIKHNITTNCYVGLKHWVSRLPVSNRFNEQNQLVISIHERVSENLLHVVSTMVNGFRDFDDSVKILSKSSEWVPFNRLLFSDKPDKTIDFKGDEIPIPSNFSVNGLPETIRITDHDGTELEVALKGLVSLLVVSRILMDTDVLGGSLGNIGYTLDNDKKVATIVNIDPGYCFSYFAESNMLHNTRKTPSPSDSKSAATLKDKRDIQCGNASGVIRWNCFSKDQKTLFRIMLKSCIDYFKARDIDAMFSMFTEGRDIARVFTMNLDIQSDIYHLYELSCKHES